VAAFHFVIVSIGPSAVILEKIILVASIASFEWHPLRLLNHYCHLSVYPRGRKPYKLLIFMFVSDITSSMFF
jgi:hypothetical protein